MEGQRVALGNAKFLDELNVDTSTLSADADRARADGATAIFVAFDSKPAGIIAIADPIKETTAAALNALAADGIRVVMLTGDNRTTARPSPASRHRRGGGRRPARSEVRGYRAASAGRPSRRHGW